MEPSAALPGLLSLHTKEKCLVIAACGLSSRAWAPPWVGSKELPQQPSSVPVWVCHARQGLGSAIDSQGTSRAAGPACMACGTEWGEIVTLFPLLISPGFPEQAGW